MIVLFWGLILRVPGVFWGYSVFDGDAEFLHHDELKYARIVGQLRDGVETYAGYPAGLWNQILFLSRVITYFSTFWGVFGNTDFFSIYYVILFGRMLSVLYGTLTIFLIYRISLNVFRDTHLSLIASFFLAQSVLHVSDSHFSTADVSATFFMYLAVYFILEFMDSQKSSALFFSSFFTGFSFGMKFMYAPIVASLFLVSQSKRKAIDLVLITTAFFVGFFVVAGSSYSLNDFITFGSFAEAYLNPPNVQKSLLINPLLYGIILLVGVSLPVFILSCYSLLSAYKKRSNLQANKFFVLLLVFGLQFIMPNLVKITPPRFILPLVPIVCMFGAFGFTKIGGRKLLLALIIIYQLFSVISVEYYYLNDPRENLGLWIGENLPQGRFSGDVFTVLPKNISFKFAIGGGASPLNRSVLDETDYLIMNEPYYRRCLRNIYANPIRQPNPQNTYHAQPEVCEFIQKTFNGETGFYLVKKYEAKPFTLEMIAYKTFFGSYSIWVGDTKLFYKSR